MGAMWLDSVHVLLQRRLAFLALHALHMTALISLIPLLYSQLSMDAEVRDSLGVNTMLPCGCHPAGSRHFACNHRQKPLPGRCLNKA